MTVPRLEFDVPSLRRLQLTAQRLAGPRARDIAEVVESVRRIQLDPTNAVARSHELVLWSRLAQWKRRALEDMLEKRRSLVEFEAFIVPTAHWPIFAAAAKQAPIGTTKRAKQTREWMKDNAALRRHILAALRQRGRLATSEFEDVAARDWPSSGWNNARNVSRMLEFLAASGVIVRAGRRGRERRWDLTDRWLPPEIRAPLPPQKALATAIELSVRARGAAPVPSLPPYTAAPWPFGGLARETVTKARDRLVADGTLVPAAIDGLKGSWFLHRDHVATLDSVRGSLPQPRTTLLSPFDAMVSDRDALERLWGFRYRLEIYVPPTKRQYGYFVLPVLHGERFIGRVDPTLDRGRGELVINRVFAEDDAPLDDETGAAIGGALVDLASFTGASMTIVGGPIPEAWAVGLRTHPSIAIR